MSLSVLALLTAVYTLLVHVRYPNLAELKQRVAALELDLETLRESLEHAQRRVAARQRRENATARAEGAPVGADPRYTVVPKDQLRLIAKQR